MIEINTTDVYCFVFNDLRSYAGNNYKHFVIYNAINEIQFINFYHNVYVFLTLYPKEALKKLYLDFTYILFLD